MKSTIFLLTAVFTASAVVAQDQPAAPAEPPVAEKAAAASPQAELEAAFIRTLTNATFTGRFCMIQDGQLGPGRDEKYTIQGVTKGEGDKWTINAEIAYAGKKFTIPVPVVVKWAGDTPVIIVDKFSIPLAGTYSARVLIYDNTYAGTWSGGDHGGLLNGAISQAPEK